MKPTTKRYIRYILLIVIAFILCRTLRAVGLDWSSNPEFWIIYGCYAIGSVLSVYEGITIRDDEIKDKTGHSYLYLYNVYKNVKASEEFHLNESHMIHHRHFDDDIDKAVVEGLNTYGLDLSRIILKNAKEEN